MVHFLYKSKKKPAKFNTDPIHLHSNTVYLMDKKTQRPRESHPNSKKRNPHAQDTILSRTNSNPAKTNLHPFSLRILCIS